ncbi:hypothetical protein [Azohydromonas sediminis]|uniref:hypothetical protein n=1 Tax=Azohydromonas sediminis TaxID=2259674 RepID=UPI001B3562B6|nr:hypothetical protein [Azohydromonas sediminis]
MHDPEAAREGGLFVAVAGRRWPLLVVDSITEAIGRGAGCAVVSGSHGGISAARFALEARVALAVFNDAGVGRDAAGIAGLDGLQREGVPACAVRHDSARIGDARSTWDDGVISHANAAAVALGARAGLAVRTWLRRA